MLETKRGIDVARIGRFFEALQENQDRSYRELQHAIEYTNAKQSRLLATMERKQKIDERSSNELQRKFLKDVLVLEEKISEVENELHDASAEMRKLSVEKWKAEAEGLSVSDTSKAVLGEWTVSGAPSSEGMLD